MSEIIDFYSGKPTSCNYTLSDIFAFNFIDMETVHDYIQWIFPLTEASQFHPNSPILTPDDINFFKNNLTLKWRVLALVNHYIRFLHFNIHWVNEHDHNHLRITRMLKFLVLIGLEQTAKERLSEIIIIARAVDPSVNLSKAEQFWGEAAYQSSI